MHLLPGVLVRLAGPSLPSRLHGRKAQLIEFDAAADQWRLRLDDGSGQEIAVATPQLEAAEAPWEDDPCGGPQENAEHCMVPMEPQPPVHGELGRKGSGMSGSDADVKTSVIRSERPASSPPHAGLRKLVAGTLYSAVFEGLVGLIILVNFVLTCIDTDAQAADGSGAQPWVGHLILACFVSVVLEVLARFYVERQKFFASAWNYVDALILVSGSLEYLLVLGNWNLGGVVRVLRICRLLRLLRIARHLSAFRELRQLLMMMGSCFRTLFWSCFLLGFVMTIWATIAVEVIHPYVKELSDLGTWGECERCRRAFSSVLNANITLFQTIIAGDSWGLLAVPIMEYQPWTACVFVGALLTLVFGVLNLVVAVVVDTFAEVRSKDLASRAQEMDHEEVEEKKVLSRMFEKIDEDQSGSISYTELQDGVRKVAEFSHWLRVMDVDADDLRQLFRIVDQDGSGEIDPEEFINAMYRLKNTESKTAIRFVKHMVTQLSDRMNEIEKRLDTPQAQVGGPAPGRCAAVVADDAAEATEDVRHRSLGSGCWELEACREGLKALVGRACREAVEAALGAAAEAAGHAAEATGPAVQWDAPSKSTAQEDPRSVAHAAVGHEHQPQPPTPGRPEPEPACFAGPADGCAGLSPPDGGTWRQLSEGPSEGRPPPRSGLPESTPLLRGPPPGMEEVRLPSKDSAADGPRSAAAALEESSALEANAARDGSGGGRAHFWQPFGPRAGPAVPVRPVVPRGCEVYAPEISPRSP